MGKSMYTVLSKKCVIFLCFFPYDNAESIFRHPFRAQRQIRVTITFSCRHSFPNVAQRKVGCFFFTNLSCRLVFSHLIDSIYFELLSWPFSTYLLTYCPSCHRQLGQQQILSISGGLEPVSVRFPINVPLLSPLPQQYVSMSSLDARVFCIPLVSIRLPLWDGALIFA